MPKHNKIDTGTAVVLAALILAIAWMHFPPTMTIINVPKPEPLPAA